MISEVVASQTAATEQGFELKTCFDQAAMNGYVKDPDYYFDSYSHFSIHEAMLKDTVRTKSYMDAIMNCPAHFKDKIVLDIGCGTGILSIFAAKAGAKHVYAIEKAGIYVHCRKIIKENGFEDRITVINGKVEEVELPVDKVDTIISEWMGYFLIYESMLDTVLFARDKWLNPGGVLLPDKATIFLAGIEDEQFYYTTTSFWDDVYGFSMKSLKGMALKTPLIFSLDQGQVVTDSCKLITFDLSKVTVAQLEFQAQFCLTANRPSVLHGIVAWFTVDFSHSKPDSKKCVVLSTSPFKKTTHWKQTLFYLQNVLPIGYQKQLKGKLTVKKAQVNHREIDVVMDLQATSGSIKRTQKYRIS